MTVELSGIRYEYIGVELVEWDGVGWDGVGGIGVCVAVYGPCWDGWGAVERGCAAAESVERCSNLGGVGAWGGARG